MNGEMFMDLHQLFIFTKVVEHKSFSKAAEAVFLSQSTVSSHIHSLEKTLNVQLFDRVGRDILITPYGERLYHWAEKLLLLKDQALIDIKESATELKGVIRIAVSSVPAQFIVPKMIKHFRKKYENVTFSLNQFPSRIVAENVLHGIADCGILGEKYENDKLHYIPLLKEKLMLISSNEFKIKGPVSIQDLIEYPFVMRNSDSGTNAILEKMLKEKEVHDDQLRVIAYADSSQSLIELVKQGIGISIISEIAAKGYSTSGELDVHDIEDFDNERFFYLVYNKKKTLSMVSKLFIEMVNETEFPPLHTNKVDFHQWGGSPSPTDG